MNIQHLKELANLATPWPWKWFTSNSHNRLSSVASGKDGDVISAFKAADGAACVSISHDDMAFIEAAHPGAVLELIERLEAADKDGREYAILAGTNAARAEKAERERDELRLEIARIGGAKAIEVLRRDAAAGEPVAWQYRYNDGKVGDWKTVDSEQECNHSPCYERRAIYTAAPPAPSVPNDYFSRLVSKARQSAEKAMIKFPQPNYVLLKVAEEAGEVVQAGVHYAEGRETWENLEGEVVQTMAMLYRLVTEGDQVNGVIPPEAPAPAPGGDDVKQG